MAKGVTVCLMAQVGLGQHIWNLSEMQIEEYFKVRLSKDHGIFKRPC